MMSLVNESNIETFIEEIQQRPVLYDYYLKDYTNIGLKKQLWEEICAVVVKNWTDLSADDKCSAVFELQKKWQGLRSCYTRELRNQKQDNRLRSGQSKKRRKYLYFEKLRFLPAKRPPGRLGGERQQDDEETTDSENEENSKESTRISPGPFFLNVGENVVQDSGDNKEKLTRKRAKQDFNAYDDYFTHDEQGNDDTKLTENDDPYTEIKTENPLHEPTMLDLLKTSQQFKEHDDGDVLFAMSLLPIISSLDEYQKMEAKIQILSVLKSVKFETAGSLHRTN